MSKNLKLAGVVVVASAADIWVLSSGMIGASALLTSFGITVMAASVMSIVAGAYTIYLKNDGRKPADELTTIEEFSDALNQYKDSKVFKDDILFALGQFGRIKKKKEKILDLLGEKFEPDEITYARFTSVISDVEGLFYDSIKNILHKIGSFDESEYWLIVGNAKNAARLSDETRRAKMELFNEYIQFVKDSIDTNEGILLNLDQLKLEIDRLKTFDNIEEMSAMQEIKTLIKQTKYYKN